MCGIAGIYNLKREPIPAHCLKPMCDVMVHRGPDDAGYSFFDVRNEPFKDEGYWIEKGWDFPAVQNEAEWRSLFGGNGQFNLALGHRRLAVIDLTESGHQPMANRANGIWLSCNGEIYNYRELGEQLKAQGHSFFSHSDNEVIIHLYEQYGLDMLNMLNGVFAFALWDGRKNRLILARDRYGARPLYYTREGDNFCFASEVKALLKIDGVTARLNHKALKDYFTFQNNFGEDTLFHGIDILKPGHYLVVEGESISTYQYWDFDFREDNGHDIDYYVNQVRTKLEQAVTRQMVADVPVGSYLSGGMDSGSITAFASRTTPRMMTFTGGFDVATAVSIENFFDERQKAELMSRELGTEHYQMIIHAGDLEYALPRVIYHAEDLRVGMSYPHFYLSQLAGKFVKVVMAGAGGDEIFAGYPWRYDLVRQCKNNAEFESITYDYWSRIIPEKNHKDFFSPHINRLVGDYSPLTAMREVLATSPDGNYSKKALYFDAKTFLHGILVIEDKLSMAHSLESRVPFLDNDLVDFATGIPIEHLVNRTWSDAARNDTNMQGKYALRRAMFGILPDAIIHNRKQGFSAPDQSWYMQNLVQYIRDTVLCDRALDRGCFQKPFIERILEEHISGQTNHRLLIWSLLSFEWWNRIFIDGDSNEFDRPKSDDRRKASPTRISLSRRSESAIISESRYR